MHARRWLPPLLAAALVLGLAGCNGAQDLKVEQIRIKSGNHQTGFAGDRLGEPLVVEVLSEKVPALLGGKSERQPMAGVEVDFRVLGDPAGAQVEIVKGVTDSGGTARAMLTLGRRNGDFDIEVSLPELPGIEPARFRAASGIRIQNNGQEGATGHTLEKPISLELQDAYGRPLAGARLELTILSGAKGTRVGADSVVTNAEGKAETTLTLGGETGRYDFMVTVQDARVAYRPFRLYAMGIGLTEILFKVLAGLAIFIFGMTMMSDGLRRVAGEKLRSVLQFFTRNRFVAILVGAGVTGIIQSSSATTVMLVGFVNAGLMTLKQSVGVIMGADIGTTATAQIISFKIGVLAFPAIIIGVVLATFVNNRQLKFWGSVVLGFGLLFFGLNLMGGVLKPLGQYPSFQAFFARIDCTPAAAGDFMPLGPTLYAVLVGTIATAIIQSSSAGIGVIMALAGAGLVNFYTAVPLFLGSNIGTCITAVLAAIGTNVNAKRVAAAHTSIKVVGVVLALLSLLLFYGGHPAFLTLINHFTPGDVFAGENIERHIANAHTIFNILMVIALVPFVGAVVVIAKFVVRKTEEEEEEGPLLQFLEPHLLDTPTIALGQVAEELLWMAQKTRKSLREAYLVFSGKAKRKEFEEKIRRREDRINNLQREITSYLVDLAQRELTADESRLLPRFIHAVNDLERIGDHAENILELAEVSGKQSITPPALQEFDKMYELVDTMLESTIDAYRKRDAGAATRARKCEDRIDAQEREMAANHVRRLEKGSCKVEAGVVFLDFAANMEKVGDHLMNVLDTFEEWASWSGSEGDLPLPPNAERPGVALLTESETDDEEPTRGHHKETPPPASSAATSEKGEGAAEGSPDQREPSSETDGEKA